MLAMRKSIPLALQMMDEPDAALRLGCAVQAPSSNHFLVFGEIITQPGVAVRCNGGADAGTQHWGGLFTGPSVNPFGANGDFLFFILTQGNQTKLAPIHWEWPPWLLSIQPPRDIV
jgi:hypothetical protein